MPVLTGRARLALAALAASAAISYALAGRAEGEADEGAGAAPDPSITGESRPEEMLFARRILMDAIGRNNDFLHDSVDGVFEWQGREVAARLDAMSAMLLAFPHLYHPATDIWSEEMEAEDASSVSLSKPEVWQEFDAFYALAGAASETALRAAQASDREAAAALINELEGQCEACHDAYRQPRSSGREEFSTGG